MVAAIRFGVNPGLLAMVIDHEGGNVRMFGDLWRNVEMLSPATSVGIGNIQPQNAVALDPTLTQSRARSLLIWDDEFSIQVAAFVLAERQQWIPPAQQSNRSLFLAYAANRDLVNVMNALDWDVQASGNAVLIRRNDVHFPAAKNNVLIGAEYFGLWGGLICASGGSCGAPA